MLTLDRDQAIVRFRRGKKPKGGDAAVRAWINP
jgi:hypothetical protein